MQRDYNGWEQLFLGEFEKPYFRQLKSFLQQEYATHKVYPPKKTYTKRLRQHCLQRRQRCNFGARSLLQRGAGNGHVFFRPQRSASANESCQHFQGNKRRPGTRQLHCGRRPYPVGKAGRVAYEHSTYRARKNAQFSQRQGVGNFHRPSDTLSQRT